MNRHEVDGGIDDLGREFNTAESLCSELNPGESRDCTFIFDVASDVNIVGLAGSITVEEGFSVAQANAEATE